jgi:hypothetical protein
MKTVTIREDELTPLTAEDIERLTALAALPDECIDLSEQPEITDAQWSRARRPGRSDRGGMAKLDPEVLAWCLDRLGASDLDHVVNTALRSLIRLEHDLTVEKAA